MTSEQENDRKIEKEGWSGTPLGELARQIDLKKAREEAERQKLEREKLARGDTLKTINDGDYDAFTDLGYTKK